MRYQVARPWSKCHAPMLTHSHVWKQRCLARVHRWRNLVKHGQTYSMLCIYIYTHVNIYTLCICIYIYISIYPFCPPLIVFFMKGMPGVQHGAVLQSRAVLPGRTAGSFGTGTGIANSSFFPCGCLCGWNAAKNSSEVMLYLFTLGFLVVAVGFFIP